MEISRLTRDGTAEPVSRDQILRHARGQGNIHIPCSADHEQDWQPYPVDPYSAICDDHTYTYICTSVTSVIFCLTEFNCTEWCRIYTTGLFAVPSVNNNKNRSRKWLLKHQSKARKMWGERYKFRRTPGGDALEERLLSGEVLLYCTCNNTRPIDFLCFILPTGIL